MPLPVTDWIPLLIPNPARRWWQFWKPKTIMDPDHPLIDMFTEHNKIMDDLPWIESDR